jgi:hypothetical protein
MKKFIDENIQHFLNEGTLPNGYEPIVMENVEEKITFKRCYWYK